MGKTVYDRVKETSTTSGTSTLTLDGAVTGYQSFSVVGDSNTCHYAIENDAGDWEIGVGTYSSGTLSRDSILSSSNSGSAVDLPSGEKAVFLVEPAAALNPIRHLQDGLVTFGTTIPITVKSSGSGNAFEWHDSGDTAKGCILDGGKVLVGASSTSRTASVSVVGSDSNTIALSLENTNGSGADTAIQFFTSSQTYPCASIRAKDEGNYSNSIYLSTKDPGGDNTTLRDRLLVYHDGSVTVNPNNDLDTSLVPLTVNVTSGQSAEIFRMVNNGTTVSSFDGNGYGFLLPAVFRVAVGTNATTGTNKDVGYIVTRSGKIVKAFARSRVATSGSTIFDINLNGTSIWASNQGNRIRIVSANTGTETSFDTTTVTEGDILTIDTDAVGATPGQDITVVILMLVKNN